MLAIISSIQNLETRLTEKEDRFRVFAVVSECGICTNSCIMPQRRAGVAARIRNFGHETRPSKKARTSQNADKENVPIPLLARWTRMSRHI